MATTAPTRDAAGSIAMIRDKDRIAHQRDEVPSKGDRAASWKHRTPERSSSIAYGTPFKLPGMESYPGGKGADGTFQRLINDIPPHQHYVEPFLGGGAILRHKEPAAGTNMGIEVHGPLASTWRDQAPQGITVVHGDGMAYLADPATHQAGTFYFVDPPYLDDTLKTGRAPYADRMSYDTHVELLHILRDRATLTGSMVMVCALPNLLYSNILHDWRTFQYQNKTRKGMQVEQVWMSYAKPTALHDYRYIGANYRERERIRRAQKRKLGELASMDPTERHALLQLIRTTYP